MTNTPAEISFNRSPYTSTLVDLFKATKPGEVVDYATITAAVGIPRAKWISLLVTARKELLRENRIALDCVRKVGYRHVPDTDIPAVGEKARGRVRRISRKAVLEMTHGLKDYNALPPSAQVEHNTRVAQLTTLHHITSAASERSLRSATEVRNSRLDVGGTLAVLRSGDKD